MQIFFYFGEKTFLVVVDSYSKWVELEYMRYGTNTNKVIQKFLNIFARFGLADVLVTDGGPPFNAHEFVNFMQKQGIVVLKSPPYHPASNGQAERTVRTVKEVFKKFLLDSRMKFTDVEEQMCYFLINYRNSCLTKTSTFPSEHVFSYKPILLDLINPKNSYKQNLVPRHLDSVESTNPVLDRLIPQVDKFNNLNPGDKLWYRNHCPKDAERWLDATFVKRMSINVFQISINGNIKSAHRDQLRLNEI